MPYIVVGVALYLLYRYYAKQQLAPLGSPGNPASADNGNGQPAAQPTDPNAPQPAPAPAPAPSPSQSVSWTPIPEGSQLMPGFDYRASAPPQNFMVMAMIPSHLASAGFINVVIHKPGDSFPNDWPDAGDMLRIEATLPPSAQPQTLNLDGVSVWQKTVTQSAGDVVRGVAARVRNAVQSLPKVQIAHGVPYPRVVHPTSNGVYAGLVRPPQR